MNILQVAQEFLESTVVPRANQMDRDPNELKVGLDGLCDLGLMALRRPSAYGGPDLRESEFRQYQELVARYSGALAFLQTQHQSAVSMISKSPNEALKSTYLPVMADGGRLLGIGFSQLRRGGPPLLTAEPQDGGYRISGHIPWLTGHGFFSEALIGAQLPDGRAVFGIIPFVATPGITISPPMQLCAMESAQTVMADLIDWHMPKDLEVFIQPPGWIQNNDMINIALQGHFAIGCARAGLDILARAVPKKGPSVEAAYVALESEWATCRQLVGQSQEMGASVDERLRARAWTIDLAVRCAHAAIAATGGAANSVDHQAQRVLREALVFTVSAQTPAVMEATLRRLVRE